MKAVTTIYRELTEFYDQIAPELGSHAHGARILYAPPRKDARVMFVGIQPGGDGPSVDPTWPTTNEYADASGARHLGRCLREMVGPDLLKHTVGTNVNFFRSTGMTQYQQIPLHLRKRITAFCTPRVVRLITELQPRTLFCIGITAFKGLKPLKTKTEMTRSNGNDALIYSGEIAGRPALGIPHLTGRLKPTPAELPEITARLWSLLE